jgi:crossover junction endodeoxyribonuclease RuvC
MRILGIDPGSSATGYGVVERRGSRIVHVAHGTLRPPRHAPLAGRLAALAAGLREVLASHDPSVAVVERVFAGPGVHAALVLGHARGVALATAAAAGVPVREYAAPQIKQAVAGTGAADKRQVQAMVSRLLGLGRVPAADAADALAAAICHAQVGRLAEHAPAGGRRRRQGRPAASRVVVRRLR